MKSAKFLPMTFLAVALAASGVMVANAQEVSPSDVTTTETAPAKDGMRGARHAKGEHGNREGRGGRRGHQAMAQIMAQIDADGDGAVTVQEVQAFRTAKVDAADTSGDGALSLEEFNTLYAEFTRNRMVDAFQDLDADGDGVISAQEIDSRVDAMTMRMDRDGDGTLDMGRRNRG